ncbi:2-phosphosulfolactate phosphatase [Nocardioides jensenii]|uniref:2-phosphosulfolactate phosphatase n=1 Tax=Nocardioides jensenii TaxID=1843 RepID=UPI00082C08EE|nr:2-phosphosulfolactate phosphatase [Nocardioides jensenii]
MTEFDPAHTQAPYAVRFDWGPVGAAAAIAPGGASYAVVVDVLSFTTTVTVAVERGIEVHPSPWRDTRAKELAMRLGATLAVGRFEALALEGRHVSLSPASMQQVTGITKLVLPSPNGSTISFDLVDSGSIVLAASLRNRKAVAAHLATALWSKHGAHAPTLTVIAAGERWADDSLRPCVEDLWGAGAVLAGLVDLGVEGLSPEARVAEQAFRAVEPRLVAEIAACASGRELTEKGFADDVEVASQLDMSDAVPVLTGESFTAA